MALEVLYPREGIVNEELFENAPVFDLVRGGVASYFDLRPRFTIADVMESGEKLDKTLLDNALALALACSGSAARMEWPPPQSSV